MDTKSFAHVEIKDETAGEVSAVFSTYDVVDHDGDVVRPGAFTDGAPVRISAYGHQSWRGVLPVGKGVIRVGEKEAVLDGQFFLKTTAGRDTFEVVREMGDLQEWSYSVDPVKHSFGEFDGQKVRFLDQINVDEVSPVLKGASIGTRTLAVKSRESKFTDHAAAVIADVRELLERTEEVIAFRADQGKETHLPELSVELLGMLGADLKRLDEILDPAAPPSEEGIHIFDEVAREYARFVALTQGVPS